MSVRRASILWACLTLGCAVGGGRDPVDAAPGADAGPGGACAAPSITCGEDCVDPGTDRLHCGGCGQLCSGACEGGECRTMDCRTSELGCPEGTSCDPGSGECVAVECGEGLVACGAECCPESRFGPPQDLSVEGRSLGLAIDGAGQPTVAYATVTDPVSVIVQRLVNGTWEQSTVASAAGDVTVSLALDEQDRAHVLWAEAASPGFSHAVDGGAGERFGDVPVVSPRLRVRPGGRPLVAYRASGELRLAERATIWVSEGVAERVGVGSIHTAFALGPDDAPHFAFTRLGSGDLEDLRYATRGPSGWTDEAVDTSGTDGVGSASEPQIAVDPSGTPHLLYWRDDEAGGDPQLWHAARSPDGSWYRAVVASSASPDRDVAIATAADGAIHVAYFDGERVMHGLSRGRGFARTPVASVRGAPEIALALDSAGAVFVLYADELGALHLASPQ